MGEIWDEHDEIIQPIRRLSGKEYLVMGSANADKLFETLGVDEETEAVSVNGWIMNSLSKYRKRETPSAFTAGR